MTILLAAYFFFTFAGILRLIVHCQRSDTTLGAFALDAMWAILVAFTLSDILTGKLTNTSALLPLVIIVGIANFIVAVAMLWEDAVRHIVKAFADQMKRFHV